MSIARDEAELKYPLAEMPSPDGRHDIGLRMQMANDLSNRRIDCRIAYVAGRQAAITDAEIDAVAALDCADATNGCCEFDGESDSDKLLWRNHARKLLEAARKAVTE